MSRAETKDLERSGAAALPAGDTVFSDVPYAREVLARVDRLGADGLCSAGRLEVVGAGQRLICLIRGGSPLLAGEIEGGGRRRSIPLRSFHEQASQLSEARASLVRHEDELVELLVAVFTYPPDLLSSTRYVDPYSLLDGLAQEQTDATVAFEREGCIALLGLTGGNATGVFFSRPQDDPGDGDPAERFLLHVLEPGAPQGRLEIYKGSGDHGDPDAGRSFDALTEEGEPPPPVDVVVRIGKDRELARRPFRSKAVVIGRDSRCEVFLDNLAVSRRHARIGWEGDHFFVEDLGSANGTRLHGQAVRIADLAVGDQIEIGKFAICLEGQRQLPGVQETMFLSARSVRTGMLLEGDGQKVRMLGSVIIGKGEGVDVTARGLGVKPVHARLEDRGEGLRLTCFAGAKVKVNGRTATEAILAGGDKIQVGRSTFTLSETTPESLADALGMGRPDRA